MIQNIDPKHLNNHYEHREPEAESCVIMMRNNRFLVHYDEKTKQILFPKWREFSQTGEVVYLFSLDEQPYFLLMDAEGLPEAYEWYEIRELRNMERQENSDIYVVFTA